MLVHVHEQLKWRWW